ncbi:MAG TPA: DUF1080 domain-containing protein [Bryobacteraceae bacterium]|jgi:hypothetical protein|nr:DUF1080 domain-containing protein [Bryobacteraceae bacterium]
MRHFVLAFFILMAALVLIAQQNPDAGFTDTPMLPGLPYHVHDPFRPHPKVVRPGGMPGQAPSDAVILFDGRDLSKWTAARLGKASYTVSADPAPWKVTNGYLEVVPKSGDIATKEKFGDVQLHLEWMEPPGVAGSSQNRGNSGVFLMGLFEIQVLDSYLSPTYADGQAGAMYGQWPPLANAVRKPGEWQSYDIVFEAPTFADGRRTKSASMTVFLNGVLLHNHKEEMGPTIYRQVPKYSAGPSEGPIILQDHGSAVRFRNIWVRRVGRYDEPEK